MKLLLIHQNLPGQFRELIGPLLRAGFDVRGIAAHEKELPIPIPCQRYKPDNPEREGIHPLTGEIDDWVRRGTRVAQIIQNQVEENWIADVVLAHPGWGETLFLKDVLPSTPMIIWPELWLREEHLGQADLSSRNYLRTKNWLLENALLQCKHAIVPTNYQAGTFPEIWQDKITVIHEGVDESLLIRERLRSLTLPSGVVLNEGTPVVSYISRNLEPLRGFGDLMRCIAVLHESRQDIHTVIVGGDGSSYSGLPPKDKSWKDAVLENVGAKYNKDLVHFVGYLPYEDLLKVLLRSDLNLYLSRNFVLSWSLIESIACGAPLLTYGNKMLKELEEVSQGLHPITYVREGDTNELAKKISELIRSPAQRPQARDLNVSRTLPNQWKRSLATEKVIGLIRNVGTNCF